MLPVMAPLVAMILNDITAEPLIAVASGAAVLMTAVADLVSTCCVDLIQAAAQGLHRMTMLLSQADRGSALVTGVMWALSLCLQAVPRINIWQTMPSVTPLTHQWCLKLWRQPICLITSSGIAVQHLRPA